MAALQASLSSLVSSPALFQARVKNDVSPSSSRTSFLGAAPLDISVRRPSTSSSVPSLSGNASVRASSGNKVARSESRPSSVATPAALLAAASVLIGEAAQAADLTAAVDNGFPVGIALASGGAIAALTAALSFNDPEKRRQKQAAEVGGDEKDAVRKYFNTAGFDRWRKIYGETDEVNKVQLDIRVGHAQTVEKVLGWLRGDGQLVGTTICDAGCGTGSLSIPLALEGASVYASDISSAMVGEAKTRAEAALAAEQSEGGSSKGVLPTFEASDLESLSGNYHTVACLDVLIHYPQDKAGAMIAHLASLADRRLILSFAPYTPYLAVLKRIGELFPGPSKATRAYLHSEEDVEAALKKVGWRVKRREMTSTQFYFSRLLEAEPISS